MPPVSSFPPGALGNILEGEGRLGAAPVKVRPSEFWHDAYTDPLRSKVVYSHVVCVVITEGWPYWPKPHERL